MEVIPNMEKRNKSIHGNCKASMLLYKNQSSRWPLKSVKLSSAFVQITKKIHFSLNYVFTESYEIYIEYQAYCASTHNSLSSLKKFMLYLLCF